METPKDPEAWLAKMVEVNGYSDGHLTPHGTYVCLSQFIFTIGIIEGQVGDDYGYSRRWCYIPPLAKPALEEWKGRKFEDEPVGWTRRI
jgi:hypothetical protein